MRQNPPRGHLPRLAQGGGDDRMKRRELERAANREQLSAWLDRWAPWLLPALLPLLVAWAVLETIARRGKMP